MRFEMGSSQYPLRLTDSKSDQDRLIEGMLLTNLADFRQWKLYEFKAMTFDKRSPPVHGLPY